MIYFDILPIIIPLVTIYIMSYSKSYKGVIWTNHAIDRLRARNIPQEYAWKAFRFPDSTKRGKASDSNEYIKKIDRYTVTIIAKQNEKKEWLILSVWIDS